MKYIFITVMALALSLTTGCKKSNDNEETQQPKALPHKQAIAPYKVDVKDVAAYKQLIEQTQQEYNSLLTAIDKLPEYPEDKYQYKGQKAAWAEGKRIFSENQVTYQRDQNIVSLEKVRLIYENMYQYGVVYAHIELMTRQAEVFRTQYPNNTDIEKLINNTFDGKYTIQEGNDYLIKGTNRDIVGNYNKIIDIVNKLNAQQ